jgi:hypothetical protein
MNGARRWPSFGGKFPSLVFLNRPTAYCVPEAGTNYKWLENLNRILANSPAMS